MGHARALLGIGTPQQMVETARRVVREGWSVRVTERAVRRLAADASGKGSGGSGSKPPDPNIQRLETQLGDTLGAAVSIEHGAKGGRVLIRYHSLDELEGILSHIR
jgi:ParB family chromosome partitioning protein